VAQMIRGQRDSVLAACFTCRWGSSYSGAISRRFGAIVVQCCVELT
jgi:hypothetical protein